MALRQIPKHIPLIRFIGSRKLLWATQATGSPSTVSSGGAGRYAAYAQAAAQAASSAVTRQGNSVFYASSLQLPTRFRNKELTERELEDIESGGADILITGP